MIATAADQLIGLGFFGILAAIIIAALYALFPLIVMWQLGGVKARIDRQRKEEAKALKQATEELQRQNTLSRQLLRAYGHEPEA
jgi:ABC-type transport system involved in cytochrome bd biosynthesis fused ATPase/permease subunit